MIEWLESEHGKSYVKAGDDKVFAYGGDGYIVIFDESKWGGLIEFVIKEATVTIKPGEGGQIEVTSQGKDENEIRQLIEDGIEKLRDYYENRYWSTP